MTGFGGLARLVVLRARAHRLLLAAAFLTVLLTTVVLATLTAFTGAIGDAALRHALADPRNAGDTALIVKADVTAEQRAAADRAVRSEARRTFDGLPVTVRTLLRSGPYALPGTPPSGDPDLTHFAALDPGQVRIVSGRAPRPAAPGTAEVEVALHQVAAEQLHLAAGARVTLVDRLGGQPVRVVITGVYRPADTSAPYWRLDDLAGRGVKQSGFTTYGPLLAAPATLTGGRVSAGQSGWLASADFSTLTTGRLDALRETSRTGGAPLRGLPALSGTTAASTSLPDVLDRVERSLLVARSTLLIVALQLVLLAACALLLVARLLTAERAAETRLLRARGASRARIAGLAALEALLLAAPAVLCAPLLAGPLTRLLAGRGTLDRIGLRPQVPALGGAGVWLVAVATALGCALAVTVPVLTRSGWRAGRARPLPAAVRAGADVALLAVAGVAYWQLDSRGAVGADSGGGLGVDPVLVAAPALALLAGTVVTLRLLPLVARLAERRAAGGRGLTSALAGWQFSRRPARQAGPLLLLVPAVALGMLAVAQGASWDRSQEDQADFRAGTAVRVTSAGQGGPARTERLAAVPHVDAVAPVARTTLPLSGNREATALAVDTAGAADALLMRPDLADGPVRPLVSGLAPRGAAVGAAVPAGTVSLRLTATLRGPGGASPAAADVTLTVQDRWGVPYDLPAGRLPADGRPHTLSPAMRGLHGPLTVTGVQLVLPLPVGHGERHRFTLGALTAAGPDGTTRALPLPAAWTAASQLDSNTSAPDGTGDATRARLLSAAPPTVEYGTGFLPADDTWASGTLTVRLHAGRGTGADATGVSGGTDETGGTDGAAAVTGVATDRFLASAGAHIGQRVDATFGGETVPVRIVGAVRELPTTAGVPGVPAASDSGGALLVDLRAVNRFLQERYGAAVTPSEWWLRTADPAGVAAAVRAWPDMEAGQVLVRDELARQLRDDPFGAGPETAFTAAAGVAAALAAVGFAVSTAGALRERDAELAVLRALGAPRRRLARMIAAEHGLLVALALAVGAALGVLLTRTVIPLIVLTSEATRPVPDVLVVLPAGRVVAVLAAVAALPLAVTAVLSRRQVDPARALREQGGE
ncbi:FtsX-like permease family protein [Streptomyces thermocoprophilus]|uniref:FtsX-like permease family protein n=1 Tax=Streptomyces thermocoprophilus TaxID=78356 RepID=A0ABV5VB08_9ACTN